MTLANAGQAPATNVVATFSSGDFVPRDTGGVRALGTLGPGQTARFWQPLFATADLRGSATAVPQVVATYTDVNGQSYESSFGIVVPGGAFRRWGRPSGHGHADADHHPDARPAPTAVTGRDDEHHRPAQLQPGSRFALNLTVGNLGRADARNVTLILGGGSGGGSSTVDGTPESGGLAGAGGSFTEFAPSARRTLAPLGNLAVGDSRDTSLQLIVNTTPSRSLPGEGVVRLHRRQGRELRR